LPVRRLNRQVCHCLFQSSSSFWPGCMNRQVYCVTIGSLPLFSCSSTWLLALSHLMRLYSLLSSASEIIPPPASAVKWFLYEFYKMAFFRFLTSLDALFPHFRSVFM